MIGEWFRRLFQGWLLRGVKDSLISNTNRDWPTVDSDPETTLGGQSARQLRDAPVGDGVDGDARNADGRGQRAEVDDAPAALGQHALADERRMSRFFNHCPSPFFTRLLFPHRDE